MARDNYHRELLAFSSFVSVGLACSGWGTNPKVGSNPKAYPPKYIDDSVYTGPGAYKLYMPCDADVIAHAWGTDRDGGWKILDDKLYTIGPAATIASIEWARTQAPDDMRCYHDENGVSWGDIQTMARVWGMSDYDAKVAIERKLVNFGQPYVRSLVDTEAGVDPRGDHGEGVTQLHTGMARPDGSVRGISFYRDVGVGETVTVMFPDGTSQEGTVSESVRNDIDGLVWWTIALNGVTVTEETEVITMWPGYNAAWVPDATSDEPFPAETVKARVDMDADGTVDFVMREYCCEDQTSAGCDYTCGENLERVPDGWETIHTWSPL